jgi:hypothetical protein
LTGFCDGYLLGAFMIKIVAGAVLALVAGFSQAGQITSAGTVVENTMGNYGYGYGPEWKMTNQVGLTANYISGVTDFDTFVTSGVTHQGGDTNSWLSTSGIYSGYLTFDLGATYDVTKFVMWNGASGISASINGFSISTSNVSDFSTYTNVGSFTGHQSHYGATVYDLLDTNARYVKLTIGGNFGNGCCTAVGDIAFDTQISAVPETETYAMLLAGLGLVGTMVRRRKAKQA